MADVDLRSRLLISLSILRQGLDPFLQDDNVEPLYSGCVPDTLPHLPEAEIRAAFECLWRLNLTQDAKHLGSACKTLNAWVIGPIFSQVLAEIATDEPAKEKWLRAISGLFPSAEELTASVNDRIKRNALAVCLAYTLADQLGQLQAFLAGSVRRDATNSEAPTPVPMLESDNDPETLAISWLIRDPSLTLSDIAGKVGVSRQTLYDWPRFLEAAERAGKYTPRRKKLGSLPYGSKSADGTMEAWRESNDD